MGYDLFFLNINEKTVSILTYGWTEIVLSVLRFLLNA